jgi:electron transport complex protein RnfD
MEADNNMTVVSSSPHAHAGSSVPKIMLTVLVALVPALIASIYFFGMDAVRLVVACVLTCVVSEAACRKLMGRDIGITDASAVLTGLLLAFNLPPALPTWIAVLGSAFSIVIGKQVFGGLGYNPFNPALIGRVFLLVSFTTPMITWSSWQIPTPIAGIEAITQATTQATPLGLVKTTLGTTGHLPFTFDAHTAWEFFRGNKNGCIGETSGLALLIGGLILLTTRVISWQVPVAFLGSVAVFSGILYVADPVTNLSPLFHLLTGGVLLGAFFMATDMVTTPVTRKGLFIFGLGCGIITMLVRKWGGYPEGVSFAILLMNAVTPLINMATRPRVFGHRK